jgi:hypothetical protein
MDLYMYFEQQNDLCEQLLFATKMASSSNKLAYCSTKSAYSKGCGQVFQDTRQTGE